MKKPSILLILGPTASGKSDLAVELAKKLDGEVVSADSRQVYKGLDIGTGKITKKEMKGVPHHLLDVISPKKSFSVSAYQKRAYEAIDDILSRNKLPILCGGTGFYIQSIIDGIIVPEVSPNPTLRKKLETLTTSDLYKKIQKLDPKRARLIDQHNKVRLIRALEIIDTLGKIPHVQKKPKYNVLQIGIKFDDTLLKDCIKTRLTKRIKMGMITEAQSLHENGLSWKRMEALGLEYRYLAYYLQQKISKEEMIQQLELRIHQYAKKQMTWFKRDERVWWVEVK